VNILIRNCYNRYTTGPLCYTSYLAPVIMISSRDNKGCSFQRVCLSVCLCVVCLHVNKPNSGSVETCYTSYLAPVIMISSRDNKGCSFQRVCLSVCLSVCLCVVCLHVNKPNSGSVETSCRVDHRVSGCEYFGRCFVRLCVPLSQRSEISLARCRRNR